MTNVSKVPVSESNIGQNTAHMWWLSSFLSNFEKLPKNHQELKSHQIHAAKIAPINWQKVPDI